MSKVLLIGWDAADWKFIHPLLDQGLMPHLESLVNGGTIGNLASLRPHLSPILWTSIATGKTADKHGITGFIEPIPGGGGVRLFSSTSRRTKALWNILSQKDMRSIVVGWYASHPAEAILGTSISNRFFDELPENPNNPWPVLPGSVHPAELSDVVSGLRMHPAEWSLDDLARFIPGVAQVDFATDDRPVQLAKLLARAVSVHSVATAALQAEPWDFAAIYYDALDVAGHTFMPFHPPKLRSVSERDFELYAHVMRELYLFHDALLGRLLELAGEQTHVLLVSDHGFHCDHLRPMQTASHESPEAMAAMWHRHYGVFAASGPGLRRDERVYGANLLDIAPTILTLLGLPVGLDMDGRPLLELFEAPPKDIATIPSWDSVHGPDGRASPETEQAMAESPEVIRQLAALGYLPAETVESAAAATIALAESKFNLAIVYSHHGRAQPALELLQQLHTDHPEHPRYALAYAKALAEARQFPECRHVIGELEEKGHRSADSDLLLASVLFNEGRADEALTRLTEAEGRYSPSSTLFALIGHLHLSAQRWPDAIVAYEKALGLDEDDAHAHNGLARASLQVGGYERAADHALTAVGLLFYFPQAHYHLGMAFKSLGDPHRAIRSLDLAVTQAPGFVEAHRELAGLYKQMNDVPRWLNHRRLAEGLPSIL